MNTHLATHLVEADKHLNEAASSVIRASTLGPPYVSPEEVSKLRVMSEDIHDLLTEISRIFDPS